MRALLLSICLLAACGQKSSDRCTTTYAQLDSKGFGGDSYGAAALEFGLACKDLTADDLACLAKASKPAEVDACAHARDALTAARKHGDGAKRDISPALADAVCACSDYACLVGVGETFGSELRTTTGDGPNGERAGKCLDKLSAARERSRASR